MTRDPIASLHLGLSAEALVLIDPQLGYPWSPGGTRQSRLLPVVVCLALLILPPVTADPVLLLSR